MTTDVQFWDKIARKYAARPIADMDAYEHTLERTRSYLAPTDHVAEIGCGTGGTALLLAPSVAHYLAADVAPEMTRIGQEQAAGVDNLRCVTLPADAPLPGAPDLDAVLAFNLLHLVPDLDAVLRVAHAGLKPGGLFISKTTCLAEKGSWLRVMVRLMQMLGKAPFVRFLKIAELEHAIQAAGFEIVETGNFPANPPSRYIVARKLR